MSPQNIDPNQRSTKSNRDNLHTVRVHFIDDSERIVPAKDFHYVGEEGARRATAIVDGRELPIYWRSEPEWGPLWYEQERKSISIDVEALSDDQLVEIYAGDDIRIIQVAMIAESAKPNAEIRLDAKAASKLFDFLLLHQDRIHRAAQEETTTPRSGECVECGRASILLDDSGYCEGCVRQAAIDAQEAE